MAADVAMDDMDIDLGMDQEIDPEIARLRAEADAILHANEAEKIELMNGVEEAAEEGEVEGTSIAPSKVHLRGVDQLSEADVRRWAEEHSSIDLFSKFQWIDDTSLNLLYDTEVAAAEALNAFSAEQTSDPLQLRQAKRLSTHPNTELLVRQAIVADVKAPGAKDRSRFYLFNPGWDPDSPTSTRRDSRKRAWRDEDYREKKYRRRDWEDQRHRSRVSREDGHFHEDMYEDGGGAAGHERRHSHTSSSDHGRRPVKYDDDLLPNRQTGRLRNRSASPTRDGDGRYGFDEEQPPRRTARARSNTPRGVRAGRDNRDARDSLRKELFPGRKGASALTNGHAASTPRELSHTRPSSSTSTTRELFPDKLHSPVHRRQVGRDIHPDEVADAIGKYSFDGSSELPAYSKTGKRPENAARRQGTDLFARVNGGPAVTSASGRLKERTEDTGFSIKGAGQSDDSPGFSILGASRERTENPLVKELFPMKAGNGSGGKDLFDGRIKGRGAQRRRAEDLF